MVSCLNLFQIISTNYGSCDSGGGASSGFNLPDLRGKFVRGWANGSSADPDRNSRNTCSSGGQSGDNVGSCQSDAFDYHQHIESNDYQGFGYYGSVE